MNELPRDCLSIPRLERVNYFYGQMLGVREFQSEQGYFHAKQRLHNRFLHGYGVVCGLAVVPCTAQPDPCAPPPAVSGPPSPVPVPPPPMGTATSTAPPPATAHPPPTATPAPVPPGAWCCVQLACGLALTCEGDEVVVRAPVQIDLLCGLDEAARNQLAAGNPVTVAISICFRAQPVDPVRPIQLDGCTGLVADCMPSRLRDDFCIKVAPIAPGEPPHDCACSPCTDGCAEPCLVLAHVTIQPGTPVTVAIDNTVRRPLAPFETTRITGVNWTHGATYLRDNADKLLDGGITITFSGPVYAETLARGVVELWGIEGGKGRSGQIFNIAGQYVGLPATGLVTSVTYQRNTHERVNYGDRILITLRSAFVLDRCCRAVDGFHIGGMAPALGQTIAPQSQPPHTVCPDLMTRWRSGNGTPGGSFESWIWVEQEATKP